MDASTKAWMAVEAAAAAGQAGAGNAGPATSSARSGPAGGPSALKPLLGRGGTASGLLVNLAAARLPRRPRLSNAGFEAVRALLAAQMPKAQVNTERRTRRREHRNVVAARFVADSWEELQCGLSRERGLWGLDSASPLDRWQLDNNEGPARMRRRLRPNPGFYVDYPFRRDRVHSATLVVENTKRKNIPVSNHAWPFFRYYLLPALQTKHGQSLLLAQLQHAVAAGSITSLSHEPIEVQLLRLLLRPTVTSEPLMSTCSYALMQAHRSIELLALADAAGADRGDSIDAVDEATGADATEAGANPGAGSLSTLQSAPSRHRSVSVAADKGQADPQASDIALPTPISTSSAAASAFSTAMAEANAIGTAMATATVATGVGGTASPSPLSPPSASVAPSLGVPTAINVSAGTTSTAPGTVGTTGQTDVSHPTVLRVLEPGEVIRSKWRCSLITGLDVTHGVLFLCKSSAYLLQGLDLDAQDNVIDAGPPEFVVQDAGASFGSAWGMGLDAYTQWTYDKMRDIRRGRYLLQDRCVPEKRKLVEEEWRWMGL